MRLLVVQSPTALELLSPHIGVFIVGFLVALIATPVMGKLASKNGIVDLPDLKRKNHAVPVAYLGGVAIFLGWFAAISTVYLLPALGFSGENAPRVLFPVSIIFGAAAIMFTGLFDDVYGIRARAKIGGQLFAAAALASQDVGVQLTRNALDVARIPWENLNTFSMLGSPMGDMLIYTVGTVLIAVFVIGACNAVNLIDGLDGLAAGVIGIATLGFLAIVLIFAAREIDLDVLPLKGMSDSVRIVMCLAILGAILGFLPYNFNPASIFMGDAGSLLLGYFAAATILLFGDTAGWALKLVTAMLIVFAVPITDTSLAIIRRKMRGYPITAPDNQHIHHLLRRSGLSVKQSVLVMYAAGVVFAVMGVSMVALDWSWRYILVVFCLLYGTIMAISFKYGAYQIELERRLQQDRDEQARLGTDAPIDQSAPADASLAPRSDDSAAGLESPDPDPAGKSRLRYESPN